MKRIIAHWPAGGGKADAVSRKAYHRLTERDGTIVNGTEKIADNVVTGDGDYAKHTRRLNTDSIGVAICGMAGAKEHPFDPGTSPITAEQFDAFCKMIADLCVEYAIPVTRETVLTHAEVEPTLGVKQNGKWDMTRLPFRLDLVGAYPVGDFMRDKVRGYLGQRSIGPYAHMPTLSIESGGPLESTRVLQRELTSLGFNVGAADGHFGPLTRNGVVAFQASNGLIANGVVDASTWATLGKAQSLPARSVSEQDLRDRGSQQIKAADDGERALTMLERGTTALLTGGGAVEITRRVQEAETALDVAQRVLLQYWPILLVGVAVLLFTRHGKQIFRKMRARRVEEARSGANLRL